MRLYVHEMNAQISKGMSIFPFIHVITRYACFLFIIQIRRQIWQIPRSSLYLESLLVKYLWFNSIHDFLRGITKLMCNHAHCKPSYIISVHVYGDTQHNEGNIREIERHFPVIPRAISVVRRVVGPMYIVTLRTYVCQLDFYVHE